MNPSRYLFILLIVPALVSVRSQAQAVADPKLVDSLIRVADSLNKILPFSPSVTSDSTAAQLADSLQVSANDTSRRTTDSLSEAASKAPKTEPYILTGKVKDKATGEGVPFATVFFSRHTGGHSGRS